MNTKRTNMTDAKNNYIQKLAAGLGSSDQDSKLFMAEQNIYPI